MRQALDIHGDNYHTLIVATGYNDSAASFAGSFVAVVNDARELGYERIVWWTLRADVDYVSPDDNGFHEIYAINNATLHRLVETGDYADVVLADWSGYSADKAEWFATDGVHHRAVGAVGGCRLPDAQDGSISTAAPVRCRATPLRSPSIRVPTRISPVRLPTSRRSTRSGRMACCAIRSVMSAASSAGSTPRCCSSSASSRKGWRGPT